MLDLSYWFNLIGFRRAVFEDAYLKSCPAHPEQTLQKLSRVSTYGLSYSRTLQNYYQAILESLNSPELLQCKFILKSCI